MGVTLGTDLDVAESHGVTKVGIGMDLHGGIDWYFNPDDKAVGFLSLQGTAMAHGSSHGWMGGASVELGGGVGSLSTVYARVLFGPAFAHGISGPDFNTSGLKIGVTGVSEMGIHLDPTMAITVGTRIMMIPRIVAPNENHLWIAQIGLGLSAHL